MNAQAALFTEPRRRPLTVWDVQRMVGAGILLEDARIELIEGELIDMPPIGPPHAGIVNRLTRAFVVATLEENAVVAVQNGLRLSDIAWPQPDIAVLKPHGSSYGTRLPTPQDVILLVEVSDTTLGYDRNRKLPLYARHGVPEVWIVDIAGRQVTRYFEPETNGYSREESLGDLAAPLLFPQCTVRLAGLFDH